MSEAIGLVMFGFMIGVFVGIAVHRLMTDTTTTGMTRPRPKH